MSFLLQNSSGSVVLYLADSAGRGVTGLTTADVQFDLKKAGSTFFSTKTLTPATPATASIGSGADGTVTLSVSVGTDGNSYTVEVVVPTGTSGLSVTKTGTAITVSLSVNGGVPVDPDNTASLVADAINSLGTEVSATASGTGADPLTTAEGPTSFSGGTDGDLLDLGAGFYEVLLNSTDLDTLGTLWVRATGNLFKTVLESFEVAAEAPDSPTPDLTIPTSAIYGYLRDIQGKPIANATVSVRVLSVPTVLHPSTEGTVIGTSLVVEQTDSTGFFTMQLISGSQVDIFIPAAGYRRTFTVPSGSANLFDIP